MSLQACAEIVRTGDPDRFLATMAAPSHLRGPLFAIFAFNVEVSRAPWVSRESMLCEMRLQWWRDGLNAIASGAPVANHEVLTPLAGVVDAHSAGVLGDLVTARSWDIYQQGFDDAAHFSRYLQDTAGGLMWASARAIGVQNGEAAIREIGYASGLANWFVAVPELVARGRKPLFDDDPAVLADLARDGLARLKAARKLVPSGARYATRTGWQANRTLVSVAANPAAVTGGRLHNSEFLRKLSLLRRVLSGSP